MHVEIGVDLTQGTLVDIRSRIFVYQFTIKNMEIKI